MNIIGNLTLSGNNGALSNKYFLYKKEMNTENKEQGYKFSRLFLNRDLKKLEKWDSGKIEVRNKVLTDRILEIWVYPNIIDQMEEPFENEEKNIFDLNDFTGKKIDYYLFLEIRKIV